MEGNNLSLAEKIREKAFLNLSWIEATRDGLYHDVEKWEKKGKQKYTQEILKALDVLNKFDSEPWLKLSDVSAVLEGYVAVPRKQLQKSIEDIKVDLLGMFCYQGPPTRHWIETKGQFWKGWNEACDKIIERLLRDDGKRPTK